MLMVHSKSKLKKTVKLVIIIHLIGIAVFGMVKCTRTSILSTIHDVTHVRDTELLFSIHAFNTLKNIAYQQYLSAYIIDNKTEKVVFYPMSTANNVRVVKSDGTYNILTITDKYNFDQAYNIYRVFTKSKIIMENYYYWVSAYKNTVVFSHPYENNYYLIYTANGLYPDSDTFKNIFKYIFDVEFVRISVHWFHCYIKSHSV